jgi:2-phospho-L-lactate guanylyltransferase
MANDDRSMTPWLLIPVKSLLDGKSRLRPVLDDDARQRLVRMLLLRMLSAASGFPGRAHTAVISECAGVLGLAAAWGALPIRQTAGGSLNDAASEGVAALRARGAGAILVAAADLPFVTSADLMDITHRANETRELVIWADKHRSGTNALHLPANTALRFRFGPDSCAAHYREGIAAVGAAAVEFNAHIAFDIDSPEDLRYWYRDTHRSGWPPPTRVCRRLL